VAINQELARLNPAVEAFQQLKKLQQARPGGPPTHVLQLTRAWQDVAALDEMVEQAADDEEMRRLAMEARHPVLPPSLSITGTDPPAPLQERDSLAAGMPEAVESLALMLAPRDEADERDIILEVRAGAGGDEAALFALDLLRMYERYAGLQGWRFELLSLTPSGAGAGGAKEASASIAGEGAYGRLKHEVGVHRVQRVPATETQGRVHTSTASVAVLPQATDVDVVLREEDVRIDTYRSSGAGGQHVNTTNSAVRATHVPTGVMVAIQDERSQHKNKAKALKVLRARLFDTARAKAAAARAAERREQIGTADRSERIRTYNQGQGRVKDHRCGVMVGDYEAVLDGTRLDEIMDALQAADRAARLADVDGGQVVKRRPADADD
jgi:peptide chain release factor 1